MKSSLRAQLEHTSIKEPDGTIHRVSKRTEPGGKSRTKPLFPLFFVGERVLYLYSSCCVLRQELRGRKQVSQGGVSRAGCAEKAAF